MDLTREQTVNDSDRALTVLGVPGRLTHRTRKHDGADGTWFHQRWISEGRPIASYGADAKMTVELRFDDECMNGYNTFAITAEVRRPKARDIEAGGCMHDEITHVFPELSELIKWHLVSTDGPMHYIANTVYHVKEGKFDYARSTAVWPDATDGDLLAESLRSRLAARLPALLAAFRKDMERIGFAWSPETT